MADRSPEHSDSSEQLTAAMSPQDEVDATSPEQAAAIAAIAVEPGQMVGEFRLIRRLGQGGMAAVWLAEQTSLHRNVALKLLRPDLMADGAYVQRFQIEAKAAAGLNHPNIVQVYVVGEDPPLHFIAQEYVQGNTLKSHIQKKGPFDVPLALHIMRQVSAALQAAGEQGIVHRDIKPENIMLTRKGEAKVADFGLAQLTLGGEKLNLTQEGVTMGTPLYMSPEQVNGKKLDARSDIYSFGVTCYHMLAGRPPFHGETAIAVAVQHLQDEPTPLKEIRPDLPLPLCELVHRMMAKRPDERYPDAATVLEDVRKLLRAAKESGRLDQVKLTELGAAPGEQTFASRHPVIALTLLALLAAGGSAAVGWSQRPGDPRLQAPAKAAGLPQNLSARELYLRAMFDVTNEDAWLELIERFDRDAQAQDWVARAHEQLALMYLRNQDRWPDAKRELDALQGMTGLDQDQYLAKARIGQAALAAFQGDHAGASAILNNARELFTRTGLATDADPRTGGSWSELLRQTRRLIERQRGEG